MSTDYSPPDDPRYPRHEPPLDENGQPPHGIPYDAGWTSGDHVVVVTVKAGAYVVTRKPGAVSELLADYPGGGIVVYPGGTVETVVDHLNRIERPAH